MSAYHDDLSCRVKIAPDKHHVSLFLAPRQNRIWILVPRHRFPEEFEFLVRELFDSITKMFKYCPRDSIVSKLRVGFKVGHEYRYTGVVAADFRSDSPRNDRGKNWKDHRQHGGCPARTPPKVTRLRIGCDDC